MSVKPSVAINAVRAVLPSSSALVATVIPCAKRSTSPASTPAPSSTARTAAITPRDCSAGVVGTFAVCTVAAPTSTASVKVPPTSTPSSISEAYARRTIPKEQPLRRQRLAVLGVGEVLVRRAVPVVRQRRALACRALAGRRAALQRLVAHRRARRLRVLHQIALREAHVADDHP